MQRIEKNVVSFHRVSSEHNIIFAQIPSRTTTSERINKQNDLSTFGVRTKSAFLRSS